MSRERPEGKNKNLTGGLFLGSNQSPKILDVSKNKRRAAAFEHSERTEQQIFFSVIRQTEPRPRVSARKITKGERKGQLEPVEHLLEPEFYNHPLIDLYRIRHFPNEGERDPRSARLDGIRAGAFDIVLDSARALRNKTYSGLRFEFKKYLTGVFSDAQKLERLILDRESYFAHYVFEANEALILLAFYLGIDPRRFVGFPRHRLAFPAAFSPEKKHDALCGCEVKVSQLIHF